ncbi:hypothetical protein [Desulfoferrobacter suflitae]|uniref:hypothetical protein n=1 Tax=Desulfoferrobacter suflitae TaxID=2865782 RepID=UPI002164ADEC|nr:hypothetical protein [Desulfoferrobacter suflitae]MCK8603967.1 hypothetical protein [Desulfoferrobacter suflitae]
MAAREQSKGVCFFCRRELAKGGLTRHLKTCPKRQEAIGKAGQKKGQPQTIYHLQVQDLWNGDYWLHLEMNGKARLQELDHYLREIWLECCGHMSVFQTGSGGWGGSEIAMSRRAEQTFEPGMVLTHIYDFGTSSETQVKVSDVRSGKPLSKHPIFLMARNRPLEFKCMQCGKSAAWLCLECVYEHDEDGSLCDEHAKDHPHHDYGEPIPLVNSPRLGMCGYTGPAEPPY